jgi:hypothetical protein
LGLLLKISKDNSTDVRLSLNRYLKYFHYEWLIGGGGGRRHMLPWTIHFGRVFKIDKAEEVHEAPEINITMA